LRFTAKYKNNSPMFNPSQEYLKNLKLRISKALKNPKTNPIAAFDADGTLWFSDVGRDFYDFQIKHGYFPQGKNHTWDDYKAIEAQGMEKGLTWLGQILAGEELSRLKQRVKLFNKEYPPVYVEAQKEIIRFLKDSGVRVLIVTASVGWTIEAAAEEFDIGPDDIVGIRTYLDGNTITDKVHYPISWAEGKVDALLEVTNGQRPFLASGNTTSDMHMVDIATDLKLVIHGSKPGDLVYESEVQALKMAKEKGWDYIDYINYSTPNIENKVW
jgi:phosphoserine phosphatase